MFPESVTTQLAHAAALHAQGRKEDAFHAYRALTQAYPQCTPAHIGLGDVLYDAVQLEMAIAAFRTALHLEPENARTHFKLGNALKERGELALAIAAYQDAIRLDPHLHAAWNRLLYCLNFTQAISSQEQCALAKRYDAVVTGGRVAAPLDLHGPDPQGRLRIGFASAEIGAHAVSYFLESYLRNYDRARIHVTLYATAERKEPQHAALRALADASRDLHTLSDDAAREVILGDRIDVLIDTTNHTLHSRLPMLARRCAPIQCHYIGHAGTTGIAAIDYFIGDDIITPPTTDDHFSEKVWRLPRLWMAYAPPADLPPVRTRSPNDPLVVGSFNNLGKVQDECLSLWIQVLRAVPEARLLLKDSFDIDDHAKGRVAKALADQGISPDRIVISGRIAQWRDHMDAYNGIDLALDTYPMNSATTGFDTLVMGTPLVALEGNWMGGRIGKDLLTRLGFPAWCARTREGYVDIVKGLAADTAALRGMKPTLQRTVLQSELCNGATLAQALDAAFVEMVARKAATERRA